MDNQSISDRVLLRINELESWLEATKSQYRLLPVRLLGYLALVILLLVSNLVAIVRWPVASLLEKFETNGEALREGGTEADSATGKPLSVDSYKLEALINSGRPVLVDFWAAWCGPCIMMNESLRRLARDVGEACLVVKLDTMKHAAAAKSHGVKGLPTLILFQNGEEVDRHVGALSYSELQLLIDRSMTDEIPRQS